MSQPDGRRALISVHDKTGAVELARGLLRLGFEIISTGGTAALLAQHDVPVTTVEALTGAAELLDGRVKTLHPSIHAAILADRANPDHMAQLARQAIQPIDVVVVNLYPFKRTIDSPDCTPDQAIEMIDIGGVALLRAAAKNFRHVLVITDPAGYELALDCLETPAASAAQQDLRRANAFAAFWQTAGYDGEIAAWLSQDANGGRPDVRTLRLWNCGPLRYGENPHQQAELLSLYDDPAHADLTAAETVLDSQQPMSFNNFLDADAALSLCAELTRSAQLSKQRCCVFVKHSNPCGCAIDADPIAAYRQAYLGDPNAAMGGVLAVNFQVQAEFAEAVAESLQRWGRKAGAEAFFIEVLVAPGFDEDAAKTLATHKPWGGKLRLLSTGEMGIAPSPADMDFRRIAGGLLIQTRDNVGLDEEQWRVVTRRQPTVREMNDLRLAWLVCKHTRSNAISICRDGTLLGNGAGQTSRVMSCRLATWLAEINGHTRQLKGAAAASDAFFPFRDGPDLLIRAGVKAIIQPGGSKRDEDTIAACDEQGVAMICTGTRHFRH